MNRLVAGSRQRVAPAWRLRGGGALRRGGVLVSAAVAAFPTQTVRASASPRAGWTPARRWSDMELLGHMDQPAGFFDPSDIGNEAFIVSDMALQGDYAFVGGWVGFNIVDISGRPTSPTAVLMWFAQVGRVICPGAGGPPSVHVGPGESGQERLHVGRHPPPAATRFRGLRIFDISDIDNPVQVAAVQTCRGRTRTRWSRTWTTASHVTSTSPERPSFARRLSSPARRPLRT